MFEVGDLIIHPQHGAGKVLKVMRMDFTGEEQKYYSVELIAGDQLMIPVSQADDAGISAISGRKKFLDVLAAQPKNLANNYRERQAAVANKIKSGDPIKVAEAFRDLAWREYTDRLPGGDLRLMSRARGFLTGLLTIQPEFDKESASQRLDQILAENFKRFETAFQVS